MKGIILTIHNKLKRFFLKVAKIIMEALPSLIAIVSFWFPVFKIWVGIIDKDITVINVILYVVSGICGLYLAWGFDKIKDILGKNNPPQKKSWEK